MSKQVGDALLDAIEWIADLDGNEEGKYFQDELKVDVLEPTHIDMGNTSEVLSPVSMYEIISPLLRDDEEVVPTHIDSVKEGVASIDITASGEPRGRHYQEPALQKSPKRLKVCDEYEEVESKEQECANVKLSSSFRGVSCCGKDRKWQARIRGEKSVQYLGRYNTEVEAALVYDQAAREIKGDSTSLTNFVKIDMATAESLNEAFIHNNYVVPAEYQHLFSPGYRKRMQRKLKLQAKQARMENQYVHPSTPMRGLSEKKSYDFDLARKMKSKKLVRSPDELQRIVESYSLEASPLRSAPFQFEKKIVS